MVHGALRAPFRGHDPRREENHTMQGSLFISYSHLDAPWMQRVKKHLEGMLMGRCRVWTDEDIPAGATWRDTLLGELRQAGAGLVLASPDYLVSPWCRRELESLAEARRQGQLAAVYWILIEPCGWQWTDLAQLQAVQEPSSRAVVDVADGPARDAHVLHCCEVVANQLGPLLKTENPVISTVKTILARSKAGALVTPIQALNEGDFSIVCRGLYANGDHVVIKVLTNTPLHRMRELFFAVSKACQGITNPSVLRTTEVFTDGEAYEQRIVLFSEKARGVPLADEMKAEAGRPATERHFTADTVRVVLRRVAEALTELHALKPIPWEGSPDMPYQHLMGPLVPRNIYYDPRTMRPQLSMVGVTNFLWHFFDPRTFRHVVGPKNGTYVLPEKRAGVPPDVRADQYFLGLLALELMAGQPLFLIAEEQEPADPLQLLSDAVWAQRHEQLALLVRRLLSPDPADRFPGEAAELASTEHAVRSSAPMRQVLDQLRKLESAERALAKYAYRRVVTPAWEGAAAGLAFARAFYDEFFRRSPAARQIFERARLARGGDAAGPIPDQTHQRKLLDGLKLVLNFNPGGQPSAIDSLAASHAGFGITGAQFADFESAFLATLDRALVAADEDDTTRAEIAAAWKSLFAPVRVEMMEIAARRGSR
jgi:hypothetical protein